jgi:hypothetical protein
MQCVYLYYNNCHNCKRLSSRSYRVTVRFQILMTMKLNVFWDVSIIIFFFVIRIVGGGVQTGSTRHVGNWMAGVTRWPGWLWWWRILVEWRFAGETEVLGENLPQHQLCPPQIPRDQTRVWTQTAAVISQRLTAWAMARTCEYHSLVEVNNWFSWFREFQIRAYFAEYSPHNYTPSKTSLRVRHTRVGNFMGEKSPAYSQRFPVRRVCIVVCWK